MGRVLPSLVRTVVPLVWAWILSWPFTGPVLDAFGVSEGTAERAVTGVVTVVVGSVYYSLVRLAEERARHLSVLLGRARRRWPWIVLVGWPSTPVYEPALTSPQRVRR